MMIISTLLYNLLQDLGMWFRLQRIKLCVDCERKQESLERKSMESK